MLGVVNHLFKALKDIWPKADDWPRLLHIQPQPHYEDHFAGNECHKLLKNIDLIQKLAKND